MGTPFGIHIVFNMLYRFVRAFLYLTRALKLNTKFVSALRNSSIYCLKETKQNWELFYYMYTLIFCSIYMNLFY